MASEAQSRANQVDNSLGAEFHSDAPALHEDNHEWIEQMVYCQDADQVHELWLAVKAAKLGALEVEEDE